MIHIPTHLALFGSFGWQEIIILGVLGVLLFGRRLPEVGRNLGKGIVEFKKGLAGLEDNVNQAAKESTAPRIEPSQQSQSQATASAEPTEAKNVQA